MDESRNDISASDLVARGRRYLQVAVGFLVTAEIIVTLAYVARLGFGNITAQVARLLLLVLLATFVLRGRSWARWLLLVLLLAAIYVVFPVFTRAEAFAPAHRTGTLLLLAMYLGYAVIARALLYSESVRAYFRATSAARAPGAHAA